MSCSVPAALPVRLQPDRSSSGQWSPHSTGDRAVVAFGPELPQTGSWRWNGQAAADLLRDRFDIRLFRDEIPECDAAVIIKYRPGGETIVRASRRSSLIWMPVDLYGSAAEIDRDAAFLRLCSRALIHCRRLRGYLQSYTRVEDIDHCLMYAVVPEHRPESRPDSPVLWTGRKTNLPPLVEWVKRHELPRRLLVLTDVGPDECDPRRFGFVSPQQITIEPWSADRHRLAARTAAAVIDIKGTGFRQRHKPPSKATDALASGLPLAMNPGSSPVEYLAGMGFDVCPPEDTQRWFSREYQEQTLDFSRMLRAHLTPEQIAGRLGNVIDEVLAERSRR